jgi:hypothetical protein
MKKILFLVFLLFIFIKSSLALTVMPAKLELELNRGEITNVEFFIRNDSEVPEIYYSEVECFTEEGEAKKFIGRCPEVEWLSLPESIALKPKEMKSILATFKVPNSAPPEAHSLVVWWSTRPTKSNVPGGVSIGLRVGSLVYINVKGEAKENFILSNIDYPKFTFKLPLKITYAIKNIGETYINPKGEIIIKNLLGKEVDRKIVNPRDLQILPNNEKIMELEWNPLFALGPYKIKFNVYGKSHSINESFWIFVLPIKLSIVFLTILIFIVFVIPWLLKKYNRFIIEKAKQKGEI